MKNSSIEIQKMALMLSMYLQDNDFFKKINRTDWAMFDAYKDK